MAPPRPPGHAAGVLALLGPFALRRGFPWRFAFRRLAAPARHPVDLTGCAARLEIYDALRPRHLPWVFSTASGEITLGGAAGTFACHLTAAATAPIHATAGRYRIVFTDSLGDEQVFLFGRLAILEHDQ
jgi:hypothetical protein